MPSLFAFLDPSPSTLLILGVIAILLFGERLPEVARSVGKGFMEFKKGVRNIQDDIEGAISAATSTETSYNYEGPAERDEATAPKFEPPPASAEATVAHGGPTKAAEAAAQMVAVNGREEGTTAAFEPEGPKFVPARSP
jgi:sec-independent protein translocase protein TatA